MLVSQKAFQIFSQKTASTGSDLLVLVFGIDFCEVLCYNSIMKTCKECGESKELTEFYVAKSNLDGLTGKCKKCITEYNCKKQEENPERHLETARRWQRKNKEQHNSSCREWSRNNPERDREAKDNWAKNHPGERASYVRKRQALKLNATPPWLTPEQVVEMKLVYIKAKELEKLDGIKRHVDHIIPLQGDSVCGLHVPWNLQILTAVENIAKSNK